ncbi:transglutaminaseTgpA domain-containing protein [Isoptericola sp. NEAU-Y5]|uniref:TransglutaminaseTgpA domain-containing protein n=1 Tax=Isoptericola luteus TaxID=2879484 RepID=A0ABS7ZE08_9MICO|nr:transglutaminaseTgpA domain-containing protein [Isoptericola sp. NEAU-Y5]MCA5893158.1 transglutaminaseTgpA domain-containing protein [Isoptericola sp. NEAU-Y5]
MIPAHSGPVVRTVALGLLVAVAVAASMLSLTTIIVPGWWVRAGLVGIALVTCTTITTRVLVERRRRARRGAGATESGSVLPTLAGAVVAAWFTLARFGGPTADLALVVGPAHVGRAISRLGEAGEIARSEVAPVTGALPIALLAVGGTLGVLLLADALAGGLRRPAAVGLPLLALWGPPLVLTGEVSWGVFVVTVTALLLLLTLEGPVGARARRSGERPPAPVRRAERSRALVTTAAAMTVAILAGLVGTASAALPGVAGGWYRAFTTTGDTIRLAEDLDILSSLTERSSAVVLRYEGSEDLSVGPLRSYTATAFDGRRWQRGAERDGEEFAPADVLWPEEPPASLRTQEVSLTVGELRDDKLPLPIDPRTVTTDEPWRYDPSRDEVIGARTDPGESYVLGVRSRDLTPEALQDAGTADLDEALTQIPDTAHADEIAQTARDVVGDAATGYDQAVALQRWLRDAGRFTYSTTLPRGGTGDPVWDFLQHRTGYCIQFATTMVVMARSLGLPTRIAVGYLPGERTDETSWEITGEDSHAWPEIYFEGAGWVRFEPTPAQQTGAAPQYTVPEVDGAAAPVPTANEFDERPTADAAPSEAASASEAPQVAAPPVDDSVPAWVWGVTAALGAGVVALFLVLLARRRRDTPPLDPERAWSQVVATLAAGGVRLPPPTTLRRAPEAIAGKVAERSGRPVAGDVLDDLGALADTVEQSRYALTPEHVDPERLESLTSSVTTGLAEQLGKP